MSDSSETGEKNATAATGLKRYTSRACRARLCQIATKFKDLAIMVWHQNNERIARHYHTDRKTDQTKTHPY